VWILHPIGAMPPARLRHHGLASALVAALLLASGATRAVSLVPGDLVVADWAANAIFRMDPTSGAQTVISSGGSIVEALDVAIGPGGDLFVANGESGSNIVRIDPATGAQSVLTTGVTFPTGLVFDAAGELLVADSFFGVRRVDPITGSVTTVSGSSVAVGITIDAAGDILITSVGGEIERVDPVTGSRTTIFTEGSGQSLFELVVDANGDLLVVDDGVDSILRVDPITGSHTVLSSGGNLSSPFGLAHDANGDLLVGDRSGKVLRVDPVTGAQTIIASGGGLTSAFGVAIVPVPEPTTALLLAAGLTTLAAARGRPARGSARRGQRSKGRDGWGE